MLKEQSLQEAHPRELLSSALIHYPEVTAAAAVAAFKDTHRRHNEYGSSVPKEITDGWKHDIDGAASDAMAAKLANIPFHTVKVGSEGAKEIFHAGIEAPSVKGEFNSCNGLPTLWGVSDVIEQTTRLSRLQDGSASVLAITMPKGIMPTDVNVHYLMKLIGPPQARGVMSLDQDHTKNLDNLLQVLKIRPYELTQITLNDATRPMNTPFVEAARKLGVNLKLVDSGDLMPGILAGGDQENNEKGYHVVATRGGMEEGTIAALGARIQGGFMEARVWDKDEKIMAQNKLYTLDDLAPETSDMALINVTGITGDDYLGIPAIEKVNENTYVSSTLTVSRNGIAMTTHFHN